MMQAILNIGLNVAGSPKVTPARALAVLRGIGAEVMRYRVAQSATEQTLVAEITEALTEVEAHHLACSLEQEAIAQRTLAGGELYGPGADAWRPFNPDYFLEF